MFRWNRWAFRKAARTGDASCDCGSALEAWRLFAKYYYLFRGTPTRIWIDYAFFHALFGLTERLKPGNADEVLRDDRQAKLNTPEFLPRALFDRFKIEVLATTDAAVDDLKWHKQIQESGWKGRVLPTFRPDAVVDSEYLGFAGQFEEARAR